MSPSSPSAAAAAAAAAASSSTTRRHRWNMFKSIVNGAKKLAIGDDANGAKPAADELFPKVNPEVDGEDCLRDCEACPTHYPKSFKIDEDDNLYGQIKGWSTHVLVATGKADWVRDVADEKGSVMQAIERAEKPSNGKLMLSASNIPTPHHTSDYSEPTTVLLLPALTVIENVTPASAPALITQYISKSAPLIRKELERHLRPLGLYRDLDDERPGGVGIYFISHVGGHKYSANVMIYRRPDAFGLDGTDGADQSAPVQRKDPTRDGEGGDLGAAQCIWLARVWPEDCEGIVKFEVLRGKVRKPERQLRGGFDRSRGLMSW
ncbi:Actin patches distal protein 1 [Cytospora mali]|uniref:Actin patches distal protein 1 n=1 Tax=Cytospora mali TaxID=578113 RepID=A0A194UPI5_CYTMA|nr:Actin patches distal protein 1 [Valsa mali var. pyri (nom. inval.)]